MIEQTYFLDMIPGESTPPVVHVSQFDVNSRTLTFNLMKGGVAFVPDAGMSVTLDGMKPDNHVFSYPMTVNGSSVSIDVLTQMTVVSGHVRCEVSVSNQSGKIGSANFILAVEESPIDSGSISESDIPIFEDLKNQAQQAAESAEQSASDAEGFAEDAETAASSVLSIVATIERSTTASHAYSVGDYLVLNGQLYEVTTAISSGETLTVGTNISATTVGSELTALNSNLTSLEDEVDSIGTATSIEDTEPYLFKSSARENVVGNIMSVHKIIGGTVAFNQFVTGMTSRSAVQGITRTVSENGTVMAYSGTATVTDNYVAFQTPQISGHKYLVTLGNVTLPSGARLSFSSVDKATYALVTIQGANDLFVAVNINSGVTVDFSIKPMVIDLTQMFGSTIADYIYSLEQATEGAGVAFFRNLFPNDYYAYNTGELISVKTSAHVMRDANNNIIGNYALDPDLELRGIPKIADGKLYYDGDEYEPSGTVTRKYGIVDLGTLNWNKISGTTSDYDFFESPTSIPTIGGTLNVICPLYKAVSAMTSSSGENKAVRITGMSLVRIRDLSYTDAASFKAAMSGVYLVYELATPTTETADACDKQQVFDVAGTEEYVDTRAVSIPVGHDTFFPTSLTSRIDALEDEFNEEITALSESIAPTETGTATQNYATGSYLMLNNRLCKVTAAIATGEQIIVGTNVQYTTIADELLAIFSQLNA